MKFKKVISVQKVFEQFPQLGTMKPKELNRHLRKVYLAGVNAGRKELYDHYFKGIRKPAIIETKQLLELKKCRKEDGGEHGS